MNTISANELKRHGVAAIERLIKKGPVNVTKRNQTVCVVLAEEEYDRLTSAATAEPLGGKLSVMEWLDLPPLGDTEKAVLDARLASQRDEWDSQ
jgi:PHD/YefM family antitoxin component YafN of YafNO toxin-antitoxin module